eukprot:CAMPEP_0175746312 /NCGR_PEP_ID=MMETSP0097-20121207/58524_1 /TAXON_ID=311494 /ORGANISM="Alexandrium monilatum, Strain CCMP3105" /LENGTH=348 /DNA_ID=CAMNT_0017054741 /DNA_START=166 /DNA_END=1211 /DNA_ORIENTATION=+
MAHNACVCGGGSRPRTWPPPPATPVGELNCCCETLGVVNVCGDRHHEGRWCLAAATDLVVAAATAADADLRARRASDLPHLATAAADQPGHQVETGRLHVQVEVRPEAPTPRAPWRRSARARLAWLYHRMLVLGSGAARLRWQIMRQLRQGGGCSGCEGMPMSHGQPGREGWHQAQGTKAGHGVGHVGGSHTPAAAWATCCSSASPSACPSSARTRDTGTGCAAVPPSASSPSASAVTKDTVRRSLPSADTFSSKPGGGPGGSCPGCGSGSPLSGGSSTRPEGNSTNSLGRDSSNVRASLADSWPLTFGSLAPGTPPVSTSGEHSGNSGTYFGMEEPSSTGKVWEASR